MINYKRNRHQQSQGGIHPEIQISKNLREVLYLVKKTTSLPKFLSYLLLLLFLPYLAFAQNDETERYRIFIDLLHVEENTVSVTVYPPPIKKDFATYVVPTTSYGGYDNAPLHKLLKSFAAFDEKGNELPFEYASQSEITIRHARALHHIEYRVKSANSVKNMDFYQARLNNINANENYIINHNGFYGYFYGHFDVPFEVNVLKPPTFFGASALPPVQSNDTLDVFETPNYFSLFENPIMYCQPDTISFQHQQTHIRVAVYSETGKVKAKQLYYLLKSLVPQLADFMGKLPVNDYAFIMYFAERKNEPLKLSQYGGLMCSSSSFYVLPEVGDFRKLRKMLLRIASHEFLHLLTPYQVSSEKTRYAGFGNTDMSAHLWLYEGATEYFTLQVLLRNGYLSEKEFLRELGKKIGLANRSRPFSLTQASRHIFRKKKHDTYDAIYHKGTVAAMLLDLELTTQSKGKLHFRDVMLQLAQRNAYFDDDALFDEITALSYPNISGFFDDFVDGRKQPPYNRFLNRLGLKYYPSKPVIIGSYGNFKLLPDFEKGRLIVKSAEGNVMGLLPHDLLLRINGSELTTGNMSEFSDLLFRPQANDELTLEVERKGEIVTLKAKAEALERVAKHTILPLPDVSEDILELREQWLYGK